MEQIAGSFQDNDQLEKLESDVNECNDQTIKTFYNMLKVASLVGRHLSDKVCVTKSPNSHVKCKAIYYQ